MTKSDKKMEIPIYGGMGVGECAHVEKIPCFPVFFRSNSVPEFWWWVGALLESFQQASIEIYTCAAIIIGRQQPRSDTCVAIITGDSTGLSFL